MGVCINELCSSDDLIGNDDGESYTNAIGVIKATQSQLGTNTKDDSHTEWIIQLGE